LGGLIRSAPQTSSTRPAANPPSPKQMIAVAISAGTFIALVDTFYLLLLARGGMAHAECPECSLPHQPEHRNCFSAAESTPSLAATRRGALRCASRLNGAPLFTLTFILDAVEVIDGAEEQGAAGDRRRRPAHLVDLVLAEQLELGAGLHHE